jgi:leucyl aminopeptidase
MPLFEEYRQAMDSEVADIKNSGGRQAAFDGQRLLE